MQFHTFVLLNKPMIIKNKATSQPAYHHQESADPEHIKRGLEHSVTY
jgi:hypothetical protein